jgi:hypothetical protein
MKNRLTSCLLCEDLSTRSHKSIIYRWASHPEERTGLRVSENRISAKSSVWLASEGESNGTLQLLDSEEFRGGGSGSASPCFVKFA